jgi:hypothetical protein
MASKGFQPPYETEKQTISLRKKGLYKGLYTGGDLKVIDVENVDNANAEQIIRALIPEQIVLQSADKFVIVKVEKEIEFQFRPHRTKSKSGSKMKKDKKDKKDKSKSVKRSRKPRRQ